MATAPPKVAPKAIEASPAVDKPKKSKKMVFISAALAMVIAAGGGAWFFLKPKTQAVTEHAVKPPIFMPLETFVVNLQGETSDQFLQVTMNLQLPDQSETDVLKTYMPLIRSRILSLLSTKKPSEILSANGKTKLAAELSEAIKQPFAKGVPPAKVDAVFFTSFVVQ